MGLRSPGAPGDDFCCPAALSTVARVHVPRHRAASCFGWPRAGARFIRAATVTERSFGFDANHSDLASRNAAVKRARAWLAPRLAVSAGPGR